MRTTIVFDKIKLLAYKTVTCGGGCGRRLQRQKTFWATRNPFNKNANGYPKDRLEIMENLRTKRGKWEKEGATCKHCTEKPPVVDETKPIKHILHKKKIKRLSGEPR